MKTGELKRLLQAIHGGKTEFPLNAERVACIGLQHRQEAVLHALRGMDANATKRLLVCVIAERMATTKTR